MFVSSQWASSPSSHATPQTHKELRETTPQLICWPVSAICSVAKQCRGPTDYATGVLCQGVRRDHSAVLRSTLVMWGHMAGCAKVNYLCYHVPMQEEGGGEGGQCQPRPKLYNHNLHFLKMRGLLLFSR